jgi:hypothetical protein
VLAFDPREQCFDLRFNGVIDTDRNGCPAGGRDHLRGFVDRLRPFVWREVAADAAPGAVHRGAGFAEGARDAAPGAARRAGNDGDLAGQGSV